MTLNKSKKSFIESTGHYYLFFEKAYELRFAADELHRAFTSVIHEVEESRIKQNGLFHACILLYAVSIENLIKSFVIKQMCKVKEYRSFNEIIKEWNEKKIDKHNPIELANSYDIVYSKFYRNIIETYTPYMAWAGRFPTPNKYNKIEQLASAKSFGFLNSNEPEIIKKLFQYTCSLMDVESLLLEY